MLRYFLYGTLFFLVFEASAQGKRLWLAIVTVHGPTKQVGLLHSVNDSLVSILPGFTRGQLLVAAEANQPFHIPVNVIKKIKIRKVRTIVGTTWEFIRLYVPIYVASAILLNPQQLDELLAVNIGSAVVALTLQSIIGVKTFDPDDASFKYAIQKYCYYPSFRVPKEVKRKR